MHLPPAAAYSVGRSPHHAGAIGVFAITDIAEIAWVVQSGWSFPGVLAVLVVAAVVIFASWSWWHSACGVLRWSGQRWMWSGWPRAVSIHVNCLLDLQGYCLVRLTDHDRASVWIALHARPGEVAPWQAMRRALVASAGVGNLLLDGDC